MTIEIEGASLPDPDALRDALREVVDPEVGMNIVDMGLIYSIDLTPDELRLEMTMTSPACPMGEMILEEVEDRLRRLLPDGFPLQVDLVWEPPWEPARMSDEARQHFGW
ncbi:metal-sulfur cluster assembly factor [Denitratisoma oestradiolicum]|uniref:Fe-S protein maturation auxiliary factor YitW n=1 Tax=Denitratisoma oestradiolicum TaxID=311182 RepID=A0A6S6Y1Q5_9PROT|nr:metal-sulfur cluster assembly factor [Denitratisoma oestradiolicum]TWO81833.1 hydroxylase [Denitratisoma oestradiolicum]CAB1370801.1 Fe-S protein maturation auxiliary factor YitW [Denitratisoma oestradiolicum]